MTEDVTLTLRERKRRRTRALLIETGRRLFEERGYDATTVADIAEAAEIGARTFFTYFQTKEQLLFAETDPRVEAATRAIDSRRDDETPAQVLLRGLDSAIVHEEAVSPVAQLRLRLMPDVPAIQARALRLQLDAQHRITEALRAAYPEGDAVELAALVGGYIGAVAAGFQHLADHPDPVARADRVRHAVQRVLMP
jgi:AcrR family transcriptional regulator